MIVLAADATANDGITPYLPFLGVILGGVIAGLVTVVRGKMGDRAEKLPSIAEIWKTVSDLQGQVSTLTVDLGRERNARVTLQSIFRSYVDRVRGGGSHELTEGEKRALEIPDNEREETSA